MNFVQRRKFLWVLFLAGLVILALTAILANATTLVRLDLARLARESTAVARLRCLATHSQWDAGEIWTETKFQVLEREKGALPAVVTVRVMGGSDGRVHARVDEAPTFRVGEEVYLFLWAKSGLDDTSEPYRVLGWSQGTFRIGKDGQTGVETVTQDSAAASIFDPGARVFRREGVRNLPVPIFRMRLRRALEGK